MFVQNYFHVLQGPAKVIVHGLVDLCAGIAMYTVSNEGAVCCLASIVLWSFAVSPSLRQLCVFWSAVEVAHRKLSQIVAGMRPRGLGTLLTRAALARGFRRVGLAVTWSEVEEQTYQVLQAFATKLGGCVDLRPQRPLDQWSAPRYPF